MATIALFIALGGSSYALSRIDGRQLRNRSVPGAKLKPNTLTGKQIRESRLRRVPNAARLAGLGPKSFLRANGTAANAARLGGLDPASFVQAGGTAANASQLGGLGPGAFERSGERFEIQDPTSFSGDEQSVTLGPFTLKPSCANNNEGAEISSSESHSAMGAVSGPDATAVDSADFSTSVAFVVVGTNTPHVVPFELWAVAPSGYRLDVHGWLGRGVLGKSCVVLGGIAYNG